MSSEFYNFFNQCTKTNLEESYQEEQERYMSHPYLVRHLNKWWNHIATMKSRYDGIDDNNPYPYKKD